MATRKFFGLVGFVTTATETAPGVFKEGVVEYEYYGDIVRNARELEQAAKVNDDFSVSNSISIVADDYANEHFHAIRYVKWAGALWAVPTVEVQSPRLLLRLGGIYNGVKV
jgi:hypothetical protein